MSSVIPIQAYDLLQDKQEVSILYTLVSLTGLSATLFMPLLIERLARRWVYTMGVVSLIVGAICFSTHSLPGQVLGMLARVLAPARLPSRSTSTSWTTSARPSSSPRSR